MTKNDLSQIRIIFKEEIREEVKKVVEDVLDKKLDQKLKPINKKLKKLQDGQNSIIKYLDEQDTHLEKRVNRIENHLHFSSSALQ